jgi:aspartate 1-decarboxylase
MVEGDQMKKIVAGKMHGITVTGADLDYHGSISHDPDHCAAVGLLPLELVDIWKKNSGARISTYITYGERGSRCCILNGAAARTFQVGEQVVNCSSHFIDPAALDGVRTKVLTFKPGNQVQELLTCAVDKLADGQVFFEILTHQDVGTEVDPA